MDHEETLLQITEILKEHNRQHEKVDHAEAVRQICEVVNQSRWIPITTRPCTDEEFEEWREIFGEGIEREEFPYFTCEMPEDGQEILISTKYGVYMDICSRDEYNSIGLENNGDWDGVLAWMPLPEPYKTEDNT